MSERYSGFPEGFFARADESADNAFYEQSRLLTHIDDRAIAEVGRLYQELALHEGEVLDICSSWISHFVDRPARLVLTGMNADELARNNLAAEWVVGDLNVDPALPFATASFDHVTCCVSVDYLVRPLEVFDEVARVMRPGGVFCCTFSNRCFPTKAIRGWLHTNDATHCEIVEEYFRRSLTDGEAAWLEPHSELRNASQRGGDPLYGVWATRR